METASDANTTQKDKIREIIEKYRRSGEISIKAKKLARKLCVAGARAYDIVEKISIMKYLSLMGTGRPTVDL